jgi:hypothetical protein
MIKFLFPLVLLASCSALNLELGASLQYGENVKVRKTQDLNVDLRQTPPDVPYGQEFNIPLPPATTLP